MARPPIPGLAGAALVLLLLGGCSSAWLTPSAAPHPMAARSETGLPEAAAADARPAPGNSAEDRADGASPRPARRWGALAGPQPRAAARRRVEQQLAANTMDDGTMGAVRGGFDTGSGVQLSFSFQQQTFVNHELVQTVVVPTVTLSRDLTVATLSPYSPVGMEPGASTTLVASNQSSGLGSSRAGVSPVLGFNFGPLGQVTGTAAPTGIAAPAGTSPSVVANGGAGPQALSLPTSVQAMVNSGLQPFISSGIATVLNNGATTAATSAGGGGLTNLISNTANNQLVEQMLRLNIGLSGLSQLTQQGAASSIANRVASTNSLFR